MKKLFCTLVILMALMFTGIQNVHAQVDIDVTWTTDCPHICTTQEECIRYVTYTIYEVCSENQTVVCHDSTTVDCTVKPVSFFCDYDCTESHDDPCFLIRATAVKACVGPGGTTIICSGSGSLNVPTCSELMDGNTVIITW